MFIAVDSAPHRPGIIVLVSVCIRAGTIPGKRIDDRCFYVIERRYQTFRRRWVYRSDRALYKCRNGVYDRRKRWSVSETQCPLQNVPAVETSGGSTALTSPGSSAVSTGASPDTSCPTPPSALLTAGMIFPTYVFADATSSSMDLFNGFAAYSKRSYSVLPCRFHSVKEPDMVVAASLAVVPVMSISVCISCMADIISEKLDIS